MSAVFSGTVAPMKWNTSDIDLIAPNAIALSVGSDQPFEFTVQYSLTGDADSNFADPVLTSDQPFPCTVYRKIPSSGANIVRVKIFNNSNVTANMVVDYTEYSATAMDS